MYTIFTMPGSKLQNHDVLAQEWFYDFMACLDMVQNIQWMFALYQLKRSVDIKMERQLHDMQILDNIVEVRSTEQFV